MRYIFILLLSTQLIMAQFFTDNKKADNSKPAYELYKDALALYADKEFDEAYEKASKARDLFEADGENPNITIEARPKYIHEGAFSPDKKQYEIKEYKNDYEVNRLIKKIKLLNPPMAFVKLSQTDESISVEVTNVGSMPLDNFTIKLDSKDFTIFPIIDKGESKHKVIYMKDKYTNISFSEEDGFAPTSISVVSWDKKWVKPKRETYIVDEDVDSFDSIEEEPLLILTINTIPKDARVRITNIKPRYKDGIELKKGNYKIEVSKKGYITKKEKINLQSSLVLNIELEKKNISKNQFNDAITIYGKCMSCHGKYGEKAALGKSKIIKNMSYRDIKDALQGYKNGTYGSNMKAIMKAFVNKYTHEQLDLLAKYIATLKESSK